MLKGGHPRVGTYRHARVLPNSSDVVHGYPWSIYPSQQALPCKCLASAFFVFLSSLFISSLFFIEVWRARPPRILRAACSLCACRAFFFFAPGVTEKFSSYPYGQERSGPLHRNRQWTATIVWCVKCCVLWSFARLYWCQGFFSFFFLVG